MDETQINTTILDHSGPGSNDKEEVTTHFPWAQPPEKA